MSQKCLSARSRDDLQRIIRELEDPSSGLPDEVFDFALAITPMTNVDLLVEDGTGRALLAWRQDRWGDGWHVPGGIIRHRETLTARISETARLELGATVASEATPLAVSQFFGRRGHFISLLYRCRLTLAPTVPIWLDRSAPPAPGDLAWFHQAPSNLYPAHRLYIPRLPTFKCDRPLDLRSIDTFNLDLD